MGLRGDKGSPEMKMGFTEDGDQSRVLGGSAV